MRMHSVETGIVNARSAAPLGFGRRNVHASRSRCPSRWSRVGLLRAPKLRRLDLGGLEPADHTADLLGHAAGLEELTLAVTPDDVALIAAAAPLGTLRLLSLMTERTPTVAKAVAQQIFASHISRTPRCGSTTP